MYLKLGWQEKLAFKLESCHLAFSNDYSQGHNLHRFLFGFLRNNNYGIVLDLM